MGIRKNMKLLVFFIPLFIMASGCKKEEPIDNYINEVYGYNFEIPEIWKEKKDKLKVIEEEKGRIVTFTYLFECDELSRDGSECQQGFFTISVMSKEDYEETLSNPFTGDILAERDEQVYLHWATLDNIILDRETIEEFNEMCLPLDEIKDRFYLDEL
ncbi:MAG: hypothetical protein GX053_00360 [Tissierella sp.]|nr:hypothetical protein [Tissierella sp.]